MDSLNYVVLVGTIERDPTVRYEDHGQPRCTLTLRLDERGPNRAMVTTCITCKGAGQMAEEMATFTGGALLSVVGKLCARPSPQGGAPQAEIVVLVRHCSPALQ